MGLVRSKERILKYFLFRFENIYCSLIIGLLRCYLFYLSRASRASVRISFFSLNFSDVVVLARPQSLGRIGVGPIATSSTWLKVLVVQKRKYFNSFSKSRYHFCSLITIFKLKYYFLVLYLSPISNRAG